MPGRRTYTPMTLICDGVMHDFEVDANVTVDEILKLARRVFFDKGIDISDTRFAAMDLWKENGNSGKAKTISKAGGAAIGTNIANGGTLYFSDVEPVISGAVSVKPGKG